MGGVRPSGNNVFSAGSGARRPGRVGRAMATARWRAAAILGSSVSGQGARRAASRGSTERPANGAATDDGSSRSRDGTARPSQKVLRERAECGGSGESGRDGVAAATAAACVGMRAVGKGEGNGESDGDKDINGKIFNGNEGVFAGRPEFATEGTLREGAIVEGTAMTPPHEGRASIKNNDVELIAFGDIITTV